ncbi:MAG: hypothetical protein AB7P03_28635 [Kofleriaceae bacterium]
MLFDQPRELPVATIRRARGAAVELLVGDFRRWLGARWLWLRPRTVPVLAAIAGMFAMLHSVSYLARPFDRSAATAIEASTPAEQDAPACAPSGPSTVVLRTR